MPTKTLEVSNEKRDAAERNTFHNLISQYVLRELGRPADFNRVDVRRLWENRYRVNVLVGLNVASIKIAHSYFLVADESGAMRAATPLLKKCY